jgi:hypothetical protein
MKLNLLSRNRVRSRERTPPITYVRAEDLKGVSGGGAPCLIMGQAHQIFACANYNN